MSIQSKFHVHDDDYCSVHWNREQPDIHDDSLSVEDIKPKRVYMEDPDDDSMNDALEHPVKEVLVCEDHVLLSQVVHFRVDLLQLGDFLES